MVARLEQMGISLGSPGDPLQPIVRELEQRGISVHRNSVGRWRRGIKSGESIACRLEAVELLRTNNAGHKNVLYRDLAQTGQEIRERQRRCPARFNSYSFTDDIAEAAGIHVTSLRRMRVAARAEMVFTEREESFTFPDAFSENWKGVANQFIADYHVSIGHASKPVVRLDEAWDHQTIGSFYRALYDPKSCGTRVIGTSAVYEVDILSEFYSLQKSAGHRLTQFDSHVLGSMIGRVDQQKLAGRLRAESGIPLSDHIFPVHLDALRGSYLS